MSYAVSVKSKPEILAMLISSFRVVFSLTFCLAISWFFNAPKLGGFACLFCFICLLVDENTTLKGRLAGIVIFVILVAAGTSLGALLRKVPDLEWLVLALAGFGAALLPIAEKYWWLVSKNVIIMFMVAVFDFPPDIHMAEGFGLGAVIAALAIIFDSFLWKKSNFDLSPMAQLTKLLTDDKNPYPYAVICGLTLVLSILSAKLFFKMMEPAWVGISVIFLVNTKLAFGFKKAIQRIGGALVGYLICLLLVPVTVNHPLVLAVLIVASASLVSFFMVKNYFIAYSLITIFILLMLNWLLQAYGGDVMLLKWRLLDTVYGSLWALLCMTITDFSDIKKYFVKNKGGEKTK